MHLFPEAKRIRFEGRGKEKGAHDRGYYLTFNASYVVICSESRALRGGTRALGPLQNRLRSKRNHFYAAFLALKCLPRTTPEHGVGVAPTRTRDVATPLAVHSAKSNTMRGRVQCMNAGRLDRFREMGEYRESFGLRNCCSQRVGREWEKCFSLVWNFLKRNCWTPFVSSV